MIYLKIEMKEWHITKHTFGNNCELVSYSPIPIGHSAYQMNILGWLAIALYMMSARNKREVIYKTLSS